MSTLPHLPYVPFGRELQGVPHVLVDSARTPDTVLELSHWPGNRTPPEFKADTSTEIVLQCLRASDAQDRLRRARAVSNDHFDVDGLLSIWPLTAPEAALELAERTVDIAISGDFDRYTTPAAVQACLALYGIERTVLQPVFQPSWDSEQITGYVYRELLGELPTLICSPERYERFWSSEYAQVSRSMETLASGSIAVREYPEIDLAVFESDDDLHDFAINAHTARLRVLTLTGRRYVLRYRYESFVDLRSRVPAPRVRLTDLLAQVQPLERSGRWFFEGPDFAHPRLQLYSNTGAPAESSITSAEFESRVVTYLRDSRGRKEREWTAADGFPESAAYVLPPSLRA